MSLTGHGGSSLETLTTTPEQAQGEAEDTSERGRGQGVTLETINNRLFHILGDDASGHQYPKWRECQGATC